MEFLLKYKCILFVLLAVGLISLILIIARRCLGSKFGEAPSFIRSKPYFPMPTDKVKKITLDNGMTALLFHNPSVPKVLIQMAYHVGSYVEQSKEFGLAHLLEHMIFKGTQKLSEGDIDAIARRYGASYNAFTSADVTSYYFETNKNNWKPFLHILADCVQNVRFDEQHLASELTAVIQELKMYKDNYWSLMFKKVTSLLFPAHHPYHHPVIGYQEDLVSVTAERLKAFYQKYYTPDRATLFIVGDFDEREVIKEIEAYFQPIVSTTKKEIQPFPVLTPELVAQHTRCYEDIKSEEVGFYWRIPGLKDPNEMISTAVAMLLGDGEGSRLHRALVDEHKVAASIGVYAQKFIEEGIFLILVEPFSGKSDECKKIIRKELERAAKEGFTARELEHVVKTHAKHFFTKLQQFKHFTYEWLNSYFATNNELELFDRVNRFVDITSKDAQQFITTYLDPFFINQIDILPIPADKQHLSKQIKKHSDELDEKILAAHVRTTEVEQPRYVNELPEPAKLDFVFPKPDRIVTLSNGLKVLMKKNNTLPLISLACTFKEQAYFSSSQEGNNLDLMMNMLIEGSEGFEKEANVHFFEFYGADYNFDAQGGSLSMLSTDVKELFNRFFHVLTKPTFPAAALNKLKDITIDSFERSKDDSFDMGLRTLKSIIYQNHPFGWTFDEAIAATKKTSLDDLKRLHTTYVNPANMLLTITGDVELDELEQIIQQVFSAWKSGQQKLISYPTPTFVPGIHKDVHLVRDQAVLLLGQPSPVTIYHPDLYPLKLLNYIGFYSLGSRLFQLRERSGLFYTAAGAWAANVSKEPGFDYVGAILNHDKLTQAEQQIRDLIDHMKTDGVTQPELNAARQLYLKTLIDAVSTNSSVADLFSSLECFDLGFDHYDKVLQRIQTISLEELNAICAQYFDTKAMARVRVGRV